MTEKTSLELLGNLEKFLSTFQNDLSAVSGQISDLQNRSQELDERLKGRKVRCCFLPFSLSVVLLSHMKENRETTLKPYY